jgi:hypothetical protein
MATDHPDRRETNQAPGRWPANVVTDGSDEVVGMFPANGPTEYSGSIGNAFR